MLWRMIKFLIKTSFVVIVLFGLFSVVNYFFDTPIDGHIDKVMSSVQGYAQKIDVKGAADTVKSYAQKIDVKAAANTASAYVRNIDIKGATDTVVQYDKKID